MGDFFWQNLFSLIGRQARSVMPLMQDQWKWVLWESNDSWTPKGTASFFPEEHQFSSADRCWAELPPQRYSVTITSTSYHDDATHGEKISERRCWAQKVKSFDDFCNWWLYTTSCTTILLLATVGGLHHLSYSVMLFRPSWAWVHLFLFSYTSGSISSK